MERKWTFILLILLMEIPSVLHAQRWKLRRYEAIFGIGSSNFFGDIGGTADDDNMVGFKDIQLQYTRPVVNIGLRYKLTGDMAAKFNLAFGVFSGNDINSRNDHRNFAFNSTIFEPSLQFEYYLLPEARGYSSAALFNRRGMINNYSKYYIYLFGGVGGIYYNPKPLKSFEERFNDNFSKFGAVFPVGLGIKYSVDAKWTLGFEFGRRFTTTDYIDGYTSQYSKHKDTYYIGVLSAVYKVRTDRRGRPILRNTFHRR